MFRKSRDSQGDLFSGILGQLGSRKQKLLEDPNSWHNVFHKEVFQRIEEAPYAVLYHHNNGRPNASVRQLISMMILKEGHGWSDEQLFDRCRFDIKVLLALGNSNFDDSIPTESTYYEFRKLLGEYNEYHHTDLLQATFAQITASQVRVLNISGKKIRMDSKLINSNIATSNRLHLIVEGVRKFIADHRIETKSLALEAFAQDLLKALRKKTTSNILYALNGKKKKETLLQLGGLIKCLLDHVKQGQNESYELLARIYREQYKEEKEEENNEGGDHGELRLKEPNEISSSSIQSIHDPDAAYRTKGNGKSKQTVSGFHANITESCDSQDDVNLILDVEVVPANICEDAFLEAAIDSSEAVLEKAHQTQATHIEEVIADGGYDSIENRNEMLKEERGKLSITKTKGAKRVYDIEETESGDYRIKHIITGIKCELSYSKKAKKYIIHNPNGTKRYMSKEEIENYINRQKIESNKDKESYNLRANVESTIHQTFHRLKKRGKIVYRGQVKCLWYVISRALWVNMTRIKANNSLNDLCFAFLTTCAFIKSLSSKNELHPNILIVKFITL